MAVFAVAVAPGDIIKYQSFVYGSFVWEIHVRYNKLYYILSHQSLMLFAMHLNPIYSVCNYDGVVFVFCIFMYEYLFVN